MNDLPPTARVMQVLMGVMNSAAVSAIARLGIPDHLHSGPKTVEELAHAVGAKPELLFRLMRATAGLGILTQTPDGRWEQTPMSDVLRSDATKTLRHFACLISDDWHVRALGSLDETVRTGEQATDRIYGMPVFAYFEKDQKSAENFNRAMTSFSTVEAPTITKAYDFSGIRSLTDVGGGHGLFLATILENHPDMNGTLFELPQVVHSLAGGPLERFKNRVRVVAGDMFTSVPAGADAYIMKRIVHDWSDEQCGKILSSCRAGVTKGGKLLVVDSVVPADANYDPSKVMDLMMMLFSGGKERTEKEFSALFAASGWRLNGTIPTASPLSIIEGVPV
jgi:O-methyltransferase/methyltransferase family protein